MKNLVRLTIALTSILCSASRLHAQDPSAPSGEFRVGISGGATYNFHSGTTAGTAEWGKPTTGWSPFTLCPFVVAEENRWGYSAGIVAEYVFGDLFGLASHVLYSTHPRSGVSTLPNGKVIVPGPQGEPEFVDQSVEIRADIAYDLLEIDLLGKGRILSTDMMGFGLALGFAAGHVLRLEQSTTSNLTTPENARFVLPTNGDEVRDSGRTIVHSENASIERTASTRFSLRGGLFLELPLFDRIHITPGVYFDYGLTPIVRESEWMLNYAMFQLDITTRL